jgi:FkbH-like protein
LINSESLVRESLVQNGKGPAKFLLISDFNVGNLASLLARNGSIEPIVAPYGQVLQLLLSRTDKSWSDAEGTIVWTSPSSITGYERARQNQDWDLEETLKEVDHFADALRVLPPEVHQIFVATWSPIHRAENRRGLLDMDPANGIAALLMRMNLRLCERRRDDPRIYFFDSARWASSVGARAYDARLWYLTKTPFAVDVFREAARDFQAALRGVQGGGRKLIALDLDNTLWGGVVGDVGWQKLRLGGHDAIGEAYLDFQRGLKALARRGVLLGLVSKNDKAIALEAIASHPEMALSAEDFAGWRIDWNDKAANLAALADDLNLGLDAVVFIDDNPAERARVSETLPQVLVPDWPSSPLEFPAALATLACFDAPFVSHEDRIRGKSYVAERKRREARHQVQSLDDWLDTLGLSVIVEELNQSNLERASQLLNKTNQFNLRTRRLTASALAMWTAASGHQLMVFRVADRFGDYGLVGIAGLSFDTVEHAAYIEDLVLSCRVLGRRVEQTMLYVIAERARRLGAESLIADFVPTPRNQPCRSFLEQSEMSSESRGKRFWLDLNRQLPRPKAVSLIERTSEAEGSNLVTKASADADESAA